MAVNVFGVLILVLATEAAGQAFVNQYPYAYQQPSYGVQGYYRYVSPYLIQRYRSVQDFYATSREDLDRKVQDAVQILTELRQNMNSLLVEARNRGDTYLQNALYRVDTAAQDVMNFQRQIMLDRTTPFQQLEMDWRNRVTSVYDNGLYTILREAEMWNGGSRMRTGGFLCTVLFGVVALLIRFL